jgi:sugar lactone lactonase YvrE
MQYDEGLTWEGGSVGPVLDSRDVVGESLVWDDRRGRLTWVDIVGRRIRRLDPATGDLETWDTGDELATSIGLRRDGGAILGLTRQVALWDWGGSFETLAVPEPEAPDHRLNEGRVAPDGSFWVATMQNNVDAEGSPVPIEGRRGLFYRVDPSGRVTRLSEDRFGIPNTMVWLPDGRFVTADTTANETYAYQLDADGRLGSRAPFAAPFDRGLPDGSCRDADGAVWTCRIVGGACLTRTLPDGRLDRVVELPCSWPTSCCFGGPGLRTLYVTSARFTMTEAHLRAHPQEGALWALDVGVAGVPEARFGSG